METKNTARSANPKKILVEALIEQKVGLWSESTIDVTRTDSQRILEALIAANGVEQTVKVMDDHGFRGESYRALIKALYCLAVERRESSE